MQLKTVPMAHQEAALAILRQKPVSALYMDPRTGKTYVDLLDTAERFEKGEIDTAIVFAPNGVHEAWVTEQIAEHFPLGIKYVAAAYKSNPKAAERDAWKTALAAPKGTLRILTINIEAMAFKPKRQMVLDIMEGHACKVTIDESHKIKGPGSKRTKALWKIGEGALIRRIQSGTSLSKGFEDLYAQYKFLDWRIIDAKTYTAYKTQFVVEILTNGGFPKITGYRDLPVLFERIKPFTFQVKREDCFDLPPQIPALHKIPVSDEQKKAYNELRTSYLTELNDGHIVEAIQGGVRVMRLQQVLCGHLPGPTPGSWVPLPCPRLDWTTELVEEEPHKVIVWCRFQADVIQVIQSLKKEGIWAVPHNGAVKTDQRTRNRELWRKEESCKAIVGDAETLGTHWNLNEAGANIFYSNTFRFDQRDQAISRNQSPGQTKKVVNHDFIAGPLDKQVLDVLAARQSMAQLFADQRVVRKWLETPL